MSAKLKKSNPVQIKESTESIIGLQLLVAELLHRELDESLLKLLRQPQVLAFFTEAEPECADYISREWSKDHFEQAAVDFCDLFIMPETACAPRAAAWLSIGGSVTTEAVDSLVNGFVTGWNIEVPASYLALPPDHASLLLYLSAIIRQAEPDQVDQFEAITLHSWLPEFGAELAQTRSPIYKVIGQLLVGDFSSR